MFFENVRNSLFGKKEKDEKNFYIIETKKEDVCHIVEEKLLEVMLMEGTDLESVKSAGYVRRDGWHIGIDDKVYERHSLNDVGLFYHDLIQKDLDKSGKNYIAALNEINSGIKTSKFQVERAEINWNFKINLIKKVYKYEGKELKQQSLTKNQKDDKAL